MKQAAQSVISTLGSVWHILLVLVLVAVVSVVGYNFIGTSSSYGDSIFAENSTFATKDWTAPASAATLTGSPTTDPTTSDTLIINYNAKEDPLLNGQTLVDKVKLFYRYMAYGGAFGDWTSFQEDDVVDVMSVTRSFTVDTTTLSDNGVYEFYTIATDVGGNVEAAPASADEAIEVDNTPPGVPTNPLPLNGTAVNPASLQMSWDAMTDPHGAVKYDFQRADNVGMTANLSTQLGLTSPNTGTTQNGLAENTYYWQVRACDTLGNCSGYTAVSSVVVDNTAPLSVVTVTNSPTADIDELVTNGGFESLLTGWTALGNVSTVTSGPASMVPHSGSRMARVMNGTATGSGTAVDVNILSQSFTNNGSGSGSTLRSIGFWYNFATHEYTTGFDEPGMMVFVGDKMVAQIWASDTLGFDVSTSIETTGWRYLSIDVTGITNPTLSLAFYAGNQGNLLNDPNNVLNNSFLFVDDVTTSEAAVGSGATYTVTATDSVGVASTHYSYTLDCDLIPVSGSAAGNTVSFSVPASACSSAAAKSGTASYYAVDTAGNTEASHTFHISIDDAAPSAVTDLEVLDDLNGDFTLKWSAPSDTNPYNISQAGEYDLRYSTAAISPGINITDWNNLAKPIIRNSNGLPGGSLRAPLQSPHQEVYDVHVNDGAATYYFAIRSKDRALNMSDLDPGTMSDPDGGSIDDPGAASAGTTTILSGDVVINEIMWMGSHQRATDEWIELRNMTDKDIDISGWVIQNLGTVVTPDITLPASSAIVANGYFVISNFAESNVGSRLLTAPNYVTTTVDLDDGSEQLTLMTSGAVVIDQTPAAAVAWTAGIYHNTPGDTNNLKQSMERNSIPSDGTLVANWHTCDSNSCADARQLYWDVTGNNYGTPGGANLSFNDTALDTAGSLIQSDSEHVVYSLQGIQVYTKLHATVEYDHQVEGQTVHEGLTEEKTFELGTKTFGSGEIYLGTCSTDSSCVPHASITNLSATIILSGDGVPDRTVFVTTSSTSTVDAPSVASDSSPSSQSEPAASPSLVPTPTNEPTPEPTTTEGPTP